MNGTNLLQPHQLIFLLPFGMAALLLLLSSVRLGGHARGGGHRHSHTGNNGAVRAAGGHGHRHTAHSNTGHTARTATEKSHSQRVKSKTDSQKEKDSGPEARHLSPGSVLFGILGFGRAPASIVLEAFGLTWGLCGYWANQFLLKTPTPTFGQLLPSLGIALGGAVLGTRAATEIFARIVPQEESEIVSQAELIGLTGRITFSTTETVGRIAIYDTFGTLHDEMCRVECGRMSIEKGKTAIVTDRDVKGHLIVEEINTV